MIRKALFVTAAALAAVAASAVAAVADTGWPS